MSETSSSVASWFSRLEPIEPSTELPRRADDPRLGQIVDFWQGNPANVTPGRAVLVGFPQDEGVRRNHGRQGAARAPDDIRRWLYRLTPAYIAPGAEQGGANRIVDLCDTAPLDVGNVRIHGDLESSQEALGEVVGGILDAGAIPIVLGGGHETAYGHFLGYVRSGKPCRIVNLDAHLDVRPFSSGLGHSGSPFRQILEHPSGMLVPAGYACLGAQPSGISRHHLAYLENRGGRVHWADEVRGRLLDCFTRERDRLAGAGASVYFTVDADVVNIADVPGVSAPNVLGLAGAEVAACALAAGRSPQISSFELVEINPIFDRDGQSSRWAALVIWHFLIGAAMRGK
jgi:formiminoglutamase